ncbi:MAG: DUF4292 domain-containing protein [Mucilaginibacter polytrichastri]|nr:DUF4292 domain-containing protein [Mucilaginibacter polytrichastri]
MWNKILAAIMVLAIAGSGCKAKKMAAANPGAKKETAVPSGNVARLKAFSAAQAGYRTFSGRAKARLGIDGKDNDVTLNLRIAKGEKIWASVTAIAGLEVARALITPDSIRVINRLEGKYIAQPFSYIHKFTSEQADFAMLEALLVGNYAEKFVNEQSTMKDDGGNVLVQGNAADLFYAIIFGANAKAAKTTITDEKKGQSLIVSDDNFLEVSGRTIPGNILISSQVKEKKIQLVINYSRIELDQNLQYPFSVPSRYQQPD